MNLILHKVIRFGNEKGHGQGVIDIKRIKLQGQGHLYYDYYYNIFFSIKALSTNTRVLKVLSNE